MNFLIELFADIFGWFGLGQAVKDFEEGNKKELSYCLAYFNVDWHSYLHHLQWHTFFRHASKDIKNSGI
jgi:hypothetical protein